MINYIKQIARDLEKCESGKGENVFELLRSLGEEIDRLDPRDFVPEGQYLFVRLRWKTRHWARQNSFSGDVYSKFGEMAREACAVLDFYSGEGSRAETRSFVFIHNSELRKIIERDYRELSLFLLPSGAWKSTVVMAGSILEAILHDSLTKDSSVRSKAIAATKAPRNRDLEKGEWRLHELIQVAVELKLLPSGRADAIDQILRDYRNFVHPLKEIRGAHPCTEAEAYLAKGALDSVCNHLEL